ncbi:MAG: family 43 glycosylhydrolase [Bacteroidales bacterium]|nr:family 43 glycosylhydrolase [Bacteroidales bacterium]
MNYFQFVILFFLINFALDGLSQEKKTYCNPMNLDYGYTPFEHFAKQGKHRTTADPVIVLFKGKYYLFSTNQEGYWISEDLWEWKFIAKKFLLPRHTVIHDLNAPGVFAMNGALYVCGSTHQADFPMWRSRSPETGKWEIAADSLITGAWDPGFYFDEETGKLYIYWGSSNEFPLLGAEIDTTSFEPVGPVKPLISLHDDIYGWERFGEFNDNTFLKPFIEGAEMIKHGNRYYLQYAAPGTEFSGYADGVYTSNHPLEGFVYQKHNPFSYKPGGFARGAGHGNTFQGITGHYWHVSTITIGVKNNFERRIGLWPANFDNDGELFSNTSYGDYPTYLPENKEDTVKFTGWMLLNFMKPVRASSTLGSLQTNFAVDEDIKTYWSANTGENGEWFESDLGTESLVFAVQTNFADQDAEFMGKTIGKVHRYQIFSSINGKKWELLVDKSNSNSDNPHDYIQLPKPIKARFIKIVNIAMPTGKFAISGFRVFGNGLSEKPEAVNDFIALRANPNQGGERRNSWLKWKLNPLADGYVIYFGKSPDKLFGSIMVYGKNEYYFSGMDSNDAYYFQIEAFNSSGISRKSSIIECP